MTTAHNTPVATARPVCTVPAMSNERCDASTTGVSHWSRNFVLLANGKFSAPPPMANAASTIKGVAMVHGDSCGCTA